MSRKTNSPIVVASGEDESEIFDAFLEEAETIRKLVKLRETLGLSTKAAIKAKAESALTLVIAHRINNLSSSIVQHFNRPMVDDDEGES